MTNIEMFEDFLENLKVKNGQSIKSRYEEITSILNNKFRNTSSQTSYSLRVGSYGRWTGINGISDLDMLYIMPKSLWQTYNKEEGQSNLLDDIKNTIGSRYSSTSVKKDRLVVQVVFQNFMIEVQPVFENDDGSFKYPDTYFGGHWKTTKPRDEIKAMQESVDQKNKNLRRLCRMIRAWKNKQGVGIGGLLVDTLAHNFLNSTNDYDNKSIASYHLMCRDFFKFMSEEPNKEYYLALGSNQRVNVKSKFQKVAKEAYELSLEAIEAGESKTAHKKWKNIFGRPFPASPTQVSESLESKSYSFDNTEESIEGLHPLDVKYELVIDSEVLQDGYRENTLRNMLARGIKFRVKKKLKFFISDHNISGDFIVKWKILNRGLEAEKRNDIRGQIIEDKGYKTREETTVFNGEHTVECFAIQNGVVVARGIIDVPISMG